VSADDLAAPERQHAKITVSLVVIFIIQDAAKNRSRVIPANAQLSMQKLQESLALASMARDDPPASSTAHASSRRRPQAARRPQCAVKWDRNL